MTKVQILSEIKRLANANGGIPVGQRSFIQETGIPGSYWRGVFWARFSDAVREAGYTPKPFTTGQTYADQNLLHLYSTLSLQLGRLPTLGDLRLKTRDDPTFPSDGTFERFGTKLELVTKLVEYCHARPEFTELVRWCEDYRAVHAKPEDAQPEVPEAPAGFVYLLKSGRYHKIGKSNACGRRERELAIQLPDKACIVHQIATDDPAGIETYWHKRFESYRKNGEWFELPASGIRAFKRRKFM